MDQFTVLLVDDEPNVLASLKRALRKEPYRILTAKDGKDALQVIQESDVHVILTDLSMPEMDGLTLLMEIRKRHPDIIRLILSGSSDSETILNAINQGSVYRYLVKPWTEIELKIVLRQAVSLFCLHQEKKQLVIQLEEHNRMLEQKVDERTRQLLKAESMAMVGRHASQLVHNLNNSLSNIFGIYYLISEGLSEEALDIQELRETCEDGILCAEKMHEIISGILDHSRDSERFENENIDINRIIREENTFFEMNKDYKYSVNKEFHFHENLPPVYGNPSQIKQILGNLIKNALDAMQKSEEKNLTISTGIENNYIVIDVQDSGTGIPEEDIPRIFSSEFTTKDVGKGTGLGLASVKSMVEAYNGTISVTTEPYKGTLFRVSLPASNV